MKQIKLLRRIINTPNIFRTEEQLKTAKANWWKKSKRKWQRHARKTQLKLGI
jgi:hypothetical protein